MADQEEGSGTVAGEAGAADGARLVCIYCLRHPRTARIVYVGRAIDPRARYRQHLRDAVSGSAKGAWLASLGKELPSLSILEEVPESEAAAAEQRWIAQVLSTGVRLVNGTHNPPKPKRLDSDLLSVKRAAEEKGVDVATIRRACASGRLKCVKVGDRAWALRWRDVEGWAPSGRGRKRNG